MRLIKILLITFATLVIGIGASAKAGDASAVCSVNNREQCEETEQAQVFGDSGHTQECDKTIVVFYGEECPHCKELNKYLSEIVKNRPEIKIERYEVWHNNENLTRMNKMMSDRNVPAKSVPVVFVGHQTFVGYGSDELTGVEIKQSIFDLYCIDEKAGERSITLPIIQKVIKISALSVPALTIILGLIDGFNPCAMWALIALLTVLLATEDKRKIRLVGAVFILSSWLIYYLFMALYLNTFLILTFATWLRYGIGALALFAGFAYLRDFKNYQPGVCKVTNAKQQRTLIERMKKVASKNSVWLIIVGVIAVSFSVNLVEMMCSLGLPVVYTQILASSQLTHLQYYLYLALYNTLYMADDIAVFVIAVYTMNFVHLSNKYERWMKLFGGILILTLGLILIFHPELLNS